MLVLGGFCWMRWTTCCLFLVVADCIDGGCCCGGIGWCWEWTAWLINQVVKEDPRFARAKVECEAEVYQMYLDVIREEKQWADYLFKHGPVIGLNANILKDFVDYTAVGALKEIGIKYQTPAPRTTPIPWFNKHVNTSNKQTALQESESTNYVIGVMGDTLDYDALPTL